MQLPQRRSARSKARPARLAASASTRRQKRRLPAGTGRGGGGGERGAAAARCGCPPGAASRYSAPPARMRYSPAASRSTSASASSCGSVTAPGAAKLSRLASAGCARVAPRSVSSRGGGPRRQLTGPAKRTRTSATRRDLHAHVGGHRVGDEALLVGARVQRLELGVRRVLV